MAMAADSGCKVHGIQLQVKNTFFHADLSESIDLNLSMSMRCDLRPRLSATCPDLHVALDGSMEQAILAGRLPYPDVDGELVPEPEIQNVRLPMSTAYDHGFDCRRWSDFTPKFIDDLSKGGSDFEDEEGEFDAFDAAAAAAYHAVGDEAEALGADEGVATVSAAWGGRKPRGRRGGCRERRRHEGDWTAGECEQAQMDELEETGLEHVRAVEPRREVHAKEWPSLARGAPPAGSRTAPSGVWSSRPAASRSQAASSGQTPLPEPSPSTALAEADALPAPRAASARGDGPPAGRARSKLWCHLYLDRTMLRKGFDLNKKIIGRGGENTKGIFDTTRAKIRLRGKGSGHIEISTGKEASAPLMLAITGEKGREDNFCEAVRMSASLLSDVERRWATFIASRQGDGRGGHVALGSTFWVGELSPDAAMRLAGTLRDLGLALPTASGGATDAVKPAPAAGPAQARRRR